MRTRLADVGTEREPEIGGRCVILFAPPAATAQAVFTEMLDLVDRDAGENRFE